MPGLFCGQLDVTLKWVPGHRDIADNETSDELARERSYRQIWNLSTAENIYVP